MEQHLLPTKEQIIKKLYDCAVVTNTDSGVKIDRLFEKEATAILELFKEKKEDLNPQHIDRNAPIYPKIEMYEIGNMFVVRTFLRKEKNGVWFDWFHMEAREKVDNQDFSYEDKVNLINALHSSVYHTLIIKDLPDNVPTHFFSVSRLQVSEKDRLLNKIPKG
jgi:hypothetical protein